MKNILRRLLLVRYRSFKGLELYLSMITANETKSKALFKSK